MAGFVTNALTAYLDQHTLDLKGKLLWAGDSLKFFQKVPRVTNSVAINYFDVSPVIQYGMFCQTMNASGSTTLYQKNLTVCDIVAEDSWCENILQKYYFTDQLKGVTNDTLGPWEARFMDQVTKKILQANETSAWVNPGQTLPSNSGTLSGTAQCQGIITQLSGDTARNIIASAYTGTVTTSNVISAITAMVTALLTGTVSVQISQEDDLYLFVSPSIHAYYKQAIFANNNFGLPIIDENGDFVIDFLGPKIIMHSTYGLIGTNYMVLTTLKNLYHGFDGESDDEKVSLWEEKKDDVLYYRAKYRLGVCYWLADYCVTNF